MEEASHRRMGPRQEAAALSTEHDTMKHVHTEWVAELAERHARMVFATAYRILGNADDAEDALQDVFLRLLSSRGTEWKPDSVRDWGAYLRVAATRAAVDLLRRQSKWNRGRRPLSDQIEDDRVEPADSRIALQAKAERLRQALARLPKRDAQVFALRYVEDFTYEQIAAEMGLNANQVGVILHRARRRLRDVLEPVLGTAGATGNRSGERDPKAREGR